MKASFVTRTLLTPLIILVAVSNLRADTTYIKFGAVWKFLDKGIEAPNGNGAANWRNTAFNDAAWKKGPAELGYGNNRERTTVNYGANSSGRYITTYFRQTVYIKDPGLYTGFVLNVYIDDGAVIYVNGKEVARMNITGKPSYATLAAAAEENGNSITGFVIPATSFVKGRNTIAVEVHQASANSSDLSFDLEMIARPATTAAEPAITRGPFLQMASETAVTVKWTTTAATTSRIKFGNSENALASTMISAENTTDHEMRITGLQPDTRYYYAIGSVNSIVKGSYRNYFRTSPPASSKRKIRVGVFGDPGTGNAMQKSSRDNYLKLKGGYNNSEMVIMLGDNAYNAGTQEEHNSRFFNIYNNNVFDNNTIFPVPGNHEYANDHARAVDHNIPYYSIFTVPTHAESGGLASGTEHYYSYDYGNIHFIMLDSYGIDNGTHLYDDTTNGQQALWLKADLTANTGKHTWTIVCLHHPPYTNGTHSSDLEQDLVGIRKKITPILERFGVDVVLAGHSHVYERSFLVKDHTDSSAAFNNGTATGGTALSFSSARYDGSHGNTASADTSASNSSCPYFTIDSAYKHGTVYVVAGSAGQTKVNSSNTYPVFYTRNHAGSIGGETGALYLEIEDNRLDAKFIGSSGTIRDRFTIMKGVNKNTILHAMVNAPAILSASWIGGYNWLAANGAPVPGPGNLRTIQVKPRAIGSFNYYVTDSTSPAKTCIADTFTLQVTSTLASAIVKYDVLVKNNKALVQWTTMQETNSDYFTVEKSANGIDFETVMVISGKGYSDTVTQYEFIDNEVLPGTSYYRLSATDKNNDRKIAGLKMFRNQTLKPAGVITASGFTIEKSRQKNAKE